MVSWLQGFKEKQLRQMLNSYAIKQELHWFSEKVPGSKKSVKNECEKSKKVDLARSKQSMHACQISNLIPVGRVLMVSTSYC